MNDQWSNFFTKATESLKRSEQCFLLRDYAEGTRYLKQAQHFLNLVLACTQSGE